MTERESNTGRSAGVNTKHSMWPQGAGVYRCIYCGCRALSPEWYANCPRPFATPAKASVEGIARPGSTEGDAT